jgi:hypothetical protein
MKARIALVGALAAVMAAVAGPTAAMAGSNDNDGASVVGVGAVSPGPGACEAGNFCLYTGPMFTGRLYKLYHCKAYSLSNWNGVGSWINNNTGGAHAIIQDRNHGTLVDTDPSSNWYNADYNFNPAWYVKAC